MNDELLMDLADCGSPEKLLTVILQHHPDWAAPVPVEKLAAAVNIVELREHETEAFEGALLTDPDKRKGAILYKAGARTPRRRFTIAHELGHFLMPSHKGDEHCTTADLRETRLDQEHRRREAEANRFAAGLLMPRPWFSRDMARLGDADVIHVQTLAERYCTSLEATANRYIDLTDDVCAFVFSKDGGIRYIRSTKTFPQLVVKAGNPLPPDCSSRRAPEEPLRVATPWAEIDGSVWLKTEWGQRSPAVLEQSVRQSNGFQVSLLFIPAEEAEAESEEAEISNSWEPRFKR
jgi:Zn-dependent peptidase ImmA (M78 family)